MTEEIYFRGVHNVTEFTRNELFVSFRQGGYQLSEASFYKKVEDMVNDCSRKILACGLPWSKAYLNFALA